jgi:hypothetical protein
VFYPGLKQAFDNEIDAKAEQTEDRSMTTDNNGLKINGLSLG